MAGGQVDKLIDPSTSDEGSSGARPRDRSILIFRVIYCSSHGVVCYS